MDMLARTLGAKEWAEALITLRRVDTMLERVGVARLMQTLEEIPTHRKVVSSDPEFRRLTNRVRMIADLQPFKAECLHQCLTLCWMLRKRGLAVDVVIGVYKFPFSAHVWLECDSQVIYWEAGLGPTTGIEHIHSMSTILRMSRTDWGVGGTVR